MTNEYIKDYYSTLKVKFDGSGKIERNYSQALQDMFVLSILNGKRNGTYVEIGGYDGIGLSNTYLLEKDFDWTGIALEIEQDKANTYNTQRKNKCLCEDAIAADYKKLFKTYKLPKRIDYLQLDIDPAEQTLEALKALPLDEYRFSVITYETDIYRSPKEVAEESRQILESNGYELLVKNVSHIDNPFEDWYIDKSLDIDQKVKDLLQKDIPSLYRNPMGVVDRIEACDVLMYDLED
jgi:hypothetical protein